MSYRFIELALDGNLLVTVNDLMPFVFLMKTNCVSGPSCPAVVYTVYSIYTLAITTSNFGPCQEIKVFVITVVSLLYVLLCTSVSFHSNLKVTYFKDHDHIRNCSK